MLWAMRMIGLVTQQWAAGARIERQFQCWNASYHHQFNTVNQQIWYSFAEFVNSFGPKTMSIGLTGGSLIWIFNRNFSQNWEIESRTNQWTMSISIYYQQNIAWTHRIREQVLIFPRESDEAETELIEHLQTNWNIFEYFAYFSPPTQLFVPYRIILR